MINLLTCTCTFIFVAVRGFHHSAPPRSRRPQTRLSAVVHEPPAEPRAKFLRRGAGAVLSIAVPSVAAAAESGATLLPQELSGDGWSCNYPAGFTAFNKPVKTHQEEKNAQS